MLTVNELFSGIGSQSAALERLGVDFKVVGIAEIDKYAIKSYETIHGPVRNYGDISKAEKLDYADFWTYSFPCQDISVAGKQRGINENTRSGLLYQVERLLEVSKVYRELPKYLMLENVKNLVGKQFKPQFDEWINRLDELGYNTYWQVLNAKNYGIPQNRERVFAISIRKDIDTGYEFPIGFDNGKRLKDILETEVDEKYYLSNKMIDYVSSSGTGGFHYKPEFNPKIAKPITASVAKMQRAGCANYITENDINQVANLNHYGNDQMNRVYGIDGISPTITVVSGGGREQKVLIPQATKQGYIECNIPGVADLFYPDSKTRRGRVQDGGETCHTITCGSQDLCLIDLPVTTLQKDNYVVETIIPFVNKKYKQFQDKNGYIPEMFNPYNCAEIKEFAPTQLAQGDSVTKSSTVLLKQDFRIRKLTPLECWRLMGFTDNQFYKAAEVNSNSQLYKQAGNSIVVDVLYYLFKNLFIENNKVNNTEIKQLEKQTDIFDFICDMLQCLISEVTRKCEQVDMMFNKGDMKC